jgi:thiosulfate reductase/polysulfide reductase chain A
MSPMQKMSRRTFLKLGGVTSGAILLGGGSAFAPAAVNAQESPEDERLYGVCGVCAMGCAYIARLRAGRINRLVGNPKDQIAEGKLCVKGYSGFRALYDPDRLKYPMKRTNPEKGVGVDPGWVRITWDEAIQITAEKLKGVIATYGPQAVALIARTDSWEKHFIRSLGSPNHICHIDMCYNTHEVVWRAMITGKGRTWTVDYEKAKYILAFGWDGLGKSKNHWGRAVNAALEKGAKLVVLDPRLSITAARAHEWIPIRPGTDLAVMLAMIRIIINEGLYDKEFVSACCSGFDQLKEAVQEYTPEWAAGLSDVPADTIVRLARDYATTKPAVIAYHKRDAGGPNHANAWRCAQCYVILDALVGSLDRPGGHIIDRTFSLPDLSDIWPMKYPDSIKGPRIDGLEKFPLAFQTGKGAFGTLAESILAQDPYPLKAAIVWHYNLLAFPNPGRLIEAFKTLDFVAVGDIMPSEMVQLADVVLPDATYFEASGISPRSYHALYPQVALRDPLPPVGDVKSFSWVALSVLRKMGLNQFAPEDMSGKALVQKQLEKLGTSLEAIRGNGGVWGQPKPFEPKTEFGTPSKKIELYSTVLEKAGADPLPRWSAPLNRPNAEYPFYLIIWRRPWHLMTSSQNDLVFYELDTRTALLNAATAAKMGIREGDLIWVESPVGKIKLRAQLTQGLRPDCVAIEHGFGHWSPGLTVAKGLGANEGDLIPNRTVAELQAVGCPAAGATLEDVHLKVYKA